MFSYEIDNDIVLELVAAKHTADLFNLTVSDKAYLGEWLPWVDQIEKESETAAFIQSSRKRFAEQTALDAVILYRGETAGIAGFNRIDTTNGVASVGYWLAAAFQGNGIMTRTVRALTDYAFEELSMHKVEVRAAAGNQASRSVPERLGFSEEGTIREVEKLRSGRVDHVVYGMLKREWDAAGNE
ncbi:GNAT family N-acetyltransferase [Bacillus daqingensis]|uniref:GNAT family N-acetyltransferase n=1 Tax=Bacillus daqingensis TaxID=872396 RepID=A0ABV9NWZ2_9BACI